MEIEEHYLKRELYEKFGRGSSIFEFLQLGSLDGITTQGNITGALG